jgi:hypothetical protein
MLLAMTAAELSLRASRKGGVAISIYIEEKNKNEIASHRL